MGREQAADQVARMILKRAEHDAPRLIEDLRLQGQDLDQIDRAVEAYGRIVLAAIDEARRMVQRAVVAFEAEANRRKDWPEWPKPISITPLETKGQRDDDADVDDRERTQRRSTE